MMTETRRRSQAHFDWPLLAAVYALSIFGVLCISMATYNRSVSEGLPLLNKILNSRSSMWQSIFLLASPVVIGVIMAVPTEVYRARVRLAYYGILGLLLVVLVAGQVSNGLRGWLNAGSRNIQISEFAKITIVMMLAKQLSRSEKPMGNFKDFMAVGLIAAVPAGVILLQGETGTVIVIVFTFIVMLYFGGVDIRVIIGICAVGAVGVGIVVAYGLMAEDPDYRIIRLLAFVDLEKYADSGGYQVLKSRTAIGAGQLTGVGTFQPGSFTTLEYVPESSTDSIITVVGECFGFVGCMVVLLVYLFIILRMLYLARFTPDKFGQLVIIGIMAMLFFHVFQNIAMGMGFMPFTGIPLPFLSYGGSNFISNIAGVALVLNITRGRSATSTVTMPLPKLNMGR